MDHVRLGVIGTGVMGQHHLRHMKSVEKATLAAFCDSDPEVLESMKKEFDVPCFGRYQDLLDSGLVDAVIIATPHYDHTPIAIEAFEKGLHVLTEKPAAVHVKDAQKMEAAWRKTDLVYGIMFQFRALPLYRKAKELIEAGEIGKITRLNYFATDWFRTQAYYNSSAWRATWEGEGGGVLLNQCPHSLDVIQWLGGMPKKVTAECALGKYHNIEVEDEVTAMLEYPDGGMGVFVASTGEAPGTNMFEICGEHGKLVMKDEKLTFFRTRTTVQEFCYSSQEGFGRPETWEIGMPIEKDPEIGGHQVITQNFVNAILNGEPLISPGTEGVKGLEIGNAILLSGLTGKPVEFPIDPDAYEKMLQSLIEKSTFKKEVKKMSGDDFAKSFHS